MRTTKNRARQTMPKLSTIPIATPKTRGTMKLLSLVVAMVSLPATALGQLMALDIRAGNAGTTLIELAHHSDMQIIFAPETVAGFTTPPVRGNLTVDQALQRMLEDSGLEYEKLSQKIIVIRRATEASNEISRNPGSAEIDPSNRPGSAATTMTTEREAGNTVEEVIVTGSYIRRPADRPQPVQVLSRIDFTSSQHFTIGEILKDMGITNGSTLLHNRGENEISPTAAINLRGIGPRGTLVLLNGRRQTVDGVAGAGVVAVDINNLVPSIMLERVEILTDGASALYGSDAVAGVVNMITRKGFEGAELAIEGQRFDRSSDNDFKVGGIFGAQGETTSVVAGFEYQDRDDVITDDLFSIERLTRSGLLSTHGNPGSFQPVGVGGATGRFPDPLCGDASLGGTPIAGVPAGNVCLMATAFGRGIVAGSERFTGLVNISHDLTDTLNAEFEFGFAHATHERAENYGTPISAAPRAIVPATNPGVIAENARSGLPIADYQVWQRIGSPLGGEDELKSVRSEQDTLRFVAALNGQFTDNWNWSGGFTYSQNDTTTREGDVLPERFQAALNCQGGVNGDSCLNPFANAYLAAPGTPEYNDPRIKNWIYVDGVGDGHAELSTFDFITSGNIGELRGGPIELALGYQHRDQKFEIDWDPITANGGFAFRSAPVPSYAGSRSSDALFAELVLFPTESLEVQLAGRHEKYDRGADSFDPKIGLLWTPTDRLFIRASAGTSFRVPGEVQTFGTTISTIVGATLNGDNVDARTVTTGNPTLSPEQAENYTAGFTWDVTDNFTLDMSYWRIDFEDLVAAESSQVIWNNDIADGIINDPRIILQESVTSNLVADLAASDIARMNLTYINQDFVKTEGVDFRFDYSFTAGMNDLVLSVQGTRTLTYELSSGGQVADGLGSYNRTNLGAPTPEYKVNAHLDWNRGNHFARFSVHHISKLEEDLPAPNPDTEEKSFTTLDLHYSYDFGIASLSLGVRNLTDEDPPIQDNSLTSTSTTTYDPRGRLFSIGLRKTF